MDAFYGFSSLEYILEECPPVSEFDKVCRICLSRSGLHSVFQYCDDFNSTPQDLSPVVLRYLGVNIDGRDSMPDKICQKCVNVLTMLLHMKQLTENSEERLKHALEVARNELQSGVKVEFHTQSEHRVIDLVNEISNSNLGEFEDSSASDIKDEMNYVCEQEGIAENEVSVGESSENTIVESLQTVNVITKSRTAAKSAKTHLYERIRCAESYSNKAGLEHHLISKHGKVRSSIWNDPVIEPRDQKPLGDSKKRASGNQCKKCAKVFRSKRGLLKHTTMHHPWFSVNASGKALCPTCDEAVERKHIVRHIMMHQKPKSDSTNVKPVNATFDRVSDVTQSEQVVSLIVPPPDDSQLSGETTQLLVLFNEVADGRAVCKLCGHEYGRKNILRHIRGHLKDEPTPKKTFKVQTHDESLPFTVNAQGKAVCKLCGNTYHRKYILRHVRTHSKRPRTPKTDPIVKTRDKISTKPAENTTFYECLSCERSFPFRGGLDQHMVSEHGKLFSCYWCDQVFKFRKSKYRHMRLACSNKPTLSFPCKECPQEFDTLKKFMLHINRHHVSAESSRELKRLFGCGKCKSTFTSTSSFKAHMSIHLNVRTLCTICGKKCGPNSLNSHMKTHAERTIKCDQCPYRTNLQNNLKIHLRSHSGERPYACELCPHRSVNMSNLIVHQLTHSGVRRFECSECGNKYNDKRLLVDHINFVHRKLRLNVCLYCNKSYGSSKHVRRHIRTVHPLECKNIKSY